MSRRSDLHEDEKSWPVRPYRDSTEFDREPLSGEQQSDRWSQDDRTGNQSISGNDEFEVPKQTQGDIRQAADQRNDGEGNDDDGPRLPRYVIGQLRGLSREAAESVKQDLLLAGSLVDDDPVEALNHAIAARDKAPRLSAVREAVAETAYAAEDYATALNEYRTLYRMTGDADYVPVLADCERALGRPGAALRLLQQVSRDDLSPAQYVETLLETAGAREDLGQQAEAFRLLREAIGNRIGDRTGQARLRYAYADLLDRQGQTEQAREWFAAAAALDDESDLDAEERLELLDGVVLEVDDAEEQDDPSERGAGAGDAELAEILDDDVVEDEEPAMAEEEVSDDLAATDRDEVRPVYLDAASSDVDDSSESVIRLSGMGE